MRNYTIFLREPENLLFGYFEYHGQDWAADSAKMAADPKNKNKPANIQEMILEGKLRTWFAENVLAEQPFVKDDSKTVGELLRANGLKLVIILSEARNPSRLEASLSKARRSPHHL